MAAVIARAAIATSPPWDYKDSLVTKLIIELFVNNVPSSFGAHAYTGRPSVITKDFLEIPQSLCVTTGHYYKVLALYKQTSSLLRLAFLKRGYR